MMHKIKTIFAQLVRIAGTILLILSMIAVCVCFFIVFGSMLKSLKAYEMLFSEIMLGVFAFLLIVLLIMKKKQSRIKKGTVLVCDLEGTFREEPPEALTEALLKPEMTFFQVIGALDSALKDSAISMLLIRIRNLKVGWGKLTELYQVLDKWKKAGKPAYCFLGDSSNKEYFLANAGYKIFINTGALLLFNGFAVELPFMKNLLDRIGIEAEFEKAGIYKSSFDLFLREHMSPEHREELSSMFTHLQDYVVKTVAESRKIAEEEIKKAVQIGVFNHKTAIECKLVDDATSLDQMKTKLLEQNNKIEFMPLARYYQIKRKKLSGGARAVVAMILVNGVLQEGKNSYNPMFGKVIGSDYIIELLEDAAKSKNICGIVIRINSPGGSGSASELIWQKIKSVSSKKPVAISMGDVAASGGYYIASAAHFITANPLAITGSIGVLSGKINIENLLKNLGINVEKIATADNANMLSIFSRMSENQKNLLRKINEDFYALFIQRIAEGRKMSPDEVEKAAQGRIWLASQALELHLIDSIGGIDTAINFIKSQNKILAHEPVKVIAFMKRKPFLQRFKLKSPI